MSLDDDIRVLSQVPLFEGFAPEQLRLLAFGAEKMQLAAGKRLFHQDEEADTAYVVTQGKIVLLRERGDERVVIGTVGVGSIIGELALISNTKRLTGAATAAESELLRLDRRLFLRVLGEYPEMAIMLHRRISDDLQALIKRIEKMGPRFAS